MSVGGNVYALLQVKDEGRKNAIGECEHTWTDCTSILGWLDLQTGDSKYLNFNAKVQESTHVFLCDFTNLKSLSTKWVWNPFNFLTGIISSDGREETVDVTSENARMVVNGLVYEILLIDNPMNMNEHLEIYLRFIGGVDKMGIEYTNNCAKVKEALSSGVQAFLYEAGGEIQAQTMRNSRVDTGQTKGSYQYKVEEGSNESTVHVGSNLENAIWEEFGTGEFALKGNGRKGGWVYKSKKDGKFYYTKGKTPKRPLFNAFNSLQGKLKTRLQEVIKSKVGG